MAKLGQKGNVSAEYSVSKDVALHLIFCNVYHITLQCIQRKVCILYTEFMHLKDYVHTEKKGKYWNDYVAFTERFNLIFDIRADETQTKQQEKLWGCVMSINDKKFYELQNENPPKGYCDTFVDKKWKKIKTRKEARENTSREEYYEFVRDIFLHNDTRNSSYQEGNSVYTNDTEETATENTKYDYRKELDIIEDELPYKYHHI